MEGIFEAILQVLIEIVLEIVGEFAGDFVERLFSSDYWTFLNRKPPITASLSNEIITLDILSNNKEIYKK